MRYDLASELTDRPGALGLSYPPGQPPAALPRPPAALYRWLVACTRREPF